MIQIGHSGWWLCFQVVETASHEIRLFFVPQNPDEDEETRQYRLKIEEQKRLREEILKKKEMRRQMQAGVRKKELLDRLNSQTNTPSQSPAPSQIQPLQQSPQTTHPVQQQQQPHLQQQEPKQQQQLQQQRPFPQRTPQSLNQPLKNPNQGTPIAPNGSAQNTTPRPNVKTRLQMVKGNTQLQQPTRPGPDQQWIQPQQNQQLLQQRRNSAMQNTNRLGAQIQSNQVSLKNIPPTSPVGPGQTLTQGPKPGAKRTVMQRAKNSAIEGQQVPQKVRVVKLSAAVSMSFYFHPRAFFVLFWSSIYLILLSRFHYKGKWQFWKEMPLIALILSIVLSKRYLTYGTDKVMCVSFWQNWSVKSFLS